MSTINQYDLSSKEEKLLFYMFVKINTRWCDCFPTDGICTPAAQLCGMLVGCLHPGCAAMQRAGHLSGDADLPHPGDEKLPLGKH